MEASKSPSLPAPTIIAPPGRWPGLALGDLWRYRSLCLVLAQRLLKVHYRQTFIGAGWAVMQPLLLMVVFTIFFGLLARLPTQGVPFPLFYFSGLAVWQVTAKILSEGSASVTSNAALVDRVYFPRIYLPTSVALSSLVDLAFNLVALMVMLALFGRVPQPTVILLPVVLGVALAVALGLAYLLSALNVAYRDVTVLLPFLTTVWFFTTPVIYPFTIVPERFAPLYFLNPMALVTSAMRWMFLDTPPPPVIAWPLGIGVSLALLVGGYLFFRQRESTFSDVV
jgi:lipopolysaccharide transport system permease protein